jgi:phosphoglycerate dehydrogenase-like enzyme
MGATFRGGIMDAGWLDRFPRLRLVSKYTIGFDDIDLHEATARGIAVTHCPTEANWGGVAEGAMAMLLALCKRVRERDAAVKSAGWRDPLLEGRYIGARADGYAGLTVGIIGLGRAGRRLAELLRPWRARLIACDPYVDDGEFVRYGVERVDLETLLERSDIVSLHCSLTDETRGLLNARTIARMKSGSMLINTARGKIVDLDALLAGLDAGRPAQAALDVFPEEPVEDIERLRAYGDRLLLSPHMVAANEGGTLRAAIPWATQAVFDALSGAFPKRVVNPEVENLWNDKFATRPLIAHREYVQD